MNKKNIIWILCDSVRVYKTDADERGRLDVMDKFAKDAIDFTAAITAAPSTIMSVSSMMTSVPSPYLSRDYAGFKGQQDAFDSHPKILRENGYNTYALLFLPDAREFLPPLFGDTCPEFMHTKSQKDKVYNNDEMIECFDHFVENKDLSKPFFLWLHLNCRDDPKLSEKVDNLLDKLKRLGLYEDTIIVMNSDHGYPDVNRGISYYDKLKLGHDLIMTDDNILAPQLIKFPGKQPLKVTSPISTMDIFPTILDYLSIQPSKTIEHYPHHGRSVLSQINNNSFEEKIFRVDNRYVFQKNSAVCFRDSNYKYIIYENENNEEFYDIKNDALEENNLISSEPYLDKIEVFREMYAKENQQILKFHCDTISQIFQEKFNLKNNFILVGEFNDKFKDIYGNSFKRFGFQVSIKKKDGYDVISAKKTK